MIKNDITKKVGIAFLANLSTLLCSFIIAFFLPKELSVLNFSYYQLFVFYSAYISIFGIGIIEGVYLYYGGQFYDKIESDIYNSLFWTFLVIELVIASAFSIFVNILVTDDNKKTVLLFLAINIVVYLPRAFVHNVFLATDKIKEYSLGIIIEKAVQVVIVFILIILRIKGFYLYIISEIIGRTISSVYIFAVAKSKLGFKFTLRNKFISTFYSVLSSGCLLLISNIANIFIVGIIRLLIEKAWNVEIFGKISLMISFSNLLIVFINSISLVLFPFVKRMNEVLYTNYYYRLQEIMTFFSMIMLMAYYPLILLLKNWLPRYSDSFLYLVVLMPICVVESKMQLIVVTFYKAIRLEKKLMLINLTFLFMSFVFGYYSCFIKKSLIFAAVSIVLILSLRYYSAHYYISKVLSVNRRIKDIEEIICIIVFLTAGLLGVTYFYALAFAVYLVMNYKDIYKAVICENYSK